MWRRRQQFLIHSYLYYVMDESLIDDAMYDRICCELVQLQRQYPDIAAQLPYHDICIQLDETASGSYIRDYPREIVSKALYLLRLYRR
jgi:hypothetical protein